MCPRGRWVHAELLVSLAGSLGSFGVSLCSLACAQGVVGFIGGRWVHPLESLG